LAGAQALPDDTAEAQGLASSYAGQNGGGLDGTTISSSILPDDTIQVAVKRQSPGIFTKLFGVDGATVGSKATARVGPLAQAIYVAPIVVNILHPALHCGGTQQRPIPCFGQPTQLDLLDLHSPGNGNAAGSFGLIDLAGNLGGNVGAGDLATWMEHGYDHMMPLGKYSSAPSANFNESKFQNALSDRIGDDVLFPIYDTLTGPGTNAQYNVIGWVGFHVTSYNANGSKGRGPTTQVPRRSVVAGSGSNTDEIKSLVASKETFAGEQITTQRFSSVAQTRVEGQLRGNLRAFQGQGEQNQLLAGTLKNNDRA